MIEEGVSLGLHEEELDEYRAHAEDAAAADDLEEVYRLKGDLQERLLDAKRHQIVRRSMNEIRAPKSLSRRSARLEAPPKLRGRNWRGPGKRSRAATSAGSNPDSTMAAQAWKKP